MAAAAPFRVRFGTRPDAPRCRERFLARGATSAAADSGGVIESAAPAAPAAPATRATPAAPAGPASAASVTSPSGAAPGASSAASGSSHSSCATSQRLHSASGLCSHVQSLARLAGLVPAGSRRHLEQLRIRAEGSGSNQWRWVVIGWRSDGGDSRPAHRPHCTQRSACARRAAEALSKYLPSGAVHAHLRAVHPKRRSNGASDVQRREGERESERGCEQEGASSAASSALVSSARALVPSPAGLFGTQPKVFVDRLWRRPARSPRSRRRRPHRRPRRHPLHRLRCLLLGLQKLHGAVMSNLRRRARRRLHACCLRMRVAQVGEECAVRGEEAARADGPLAWRDGRDS